jgi:hypothetical protein
VSNPAWTTGIASPSIHLLWSGSGVAFAREAGSIGWRGSPQNSALRSPFAIYWTDFLTTACGGLRREASEHGVYLPDLEQKRPPDKPPRMVKLRLVRKK